MGSKLQLLGRFWCGRIGFSVLCLVLCILVNRKVRKGAKLCLTEWLVEDCLGLFVDLVKYKLCCAKNSSYH